MDDKTHAAPPDSRGPEIDGLTGEPEVVDGEEASTGPPLHYHAHPHDPLSAEERRRSRAALYLVLLLVGVLLILIPYFGMVFTMAD